MLCILISDTSLLSVCDNLIEDNDTARGDYCVVVYEKDYPALPPDFLSRHKVYCLDSLCSPYLPSPLREDFPPPSKIYAISPHDKMGKNITCYSFLDRYPQAERYRVMTSQEIQPYCLRPIERMIMIAYNSMRNAGTIIAWCISKIIPSDNRSRPWINARLDEGGYWPVADAGMDEVILLAEQQHPLIAYAEKEIAKQYPEAVVIKLADLSLPSHPGSRTAIVVLPGEAVSAPGVFKLLRLRKEHPGMLLVFDSNGAKKRVNDAYLGFLIARSFYSFGLDLCFLLVGLLFLLSYAASQLVQLPIDYLKKRGLFSGKTVGVTFVARGHHWRGLKRRPQQLMTLAAREYRCLFVEKSLYLSSLLFETRQIVGSRVERERWRCHLLAGRWCGTNLLYVPHFVINVTKNISWSISIAEWLSGQFLRVAALRAGVLRGNEVFLANPLFPKKTLDMLPRKGLVYNCLDEYSTYPMYLQSPAWDLVVAGDRHYSERADLVISVNDDLARAKAAYNSRSFAVYNGTDFDHYQSMGGRLEKSLQTMIESLPHPLVGYCGGMSVNRNDKINHELLETIASRRPELHWLVIGPSEGMEETVFGRLPNVTFLGFISYEYLPAIFRYVDVWTIPHLVNKLTDNMSPLKLYDYLASGKPVVSTPVRQVLGFADQVYIADNIDEFEEKLLAAIVENDLELGEARIAVAKQHSWTGRYAQLKKLVRQHSCTRDTS